MKVINKDTSIKDCGLSTRTINLLYQNAKEFGVETRFGENVRDITVGDLEGFSATKLRGFKRFGGSTLRELKYVLDTAGVNLDMENLSIKPYKGSTISFIRFTKEGKVLYDTWPDYLRSRIRKF